MNTSRRPANSKRPRRWYRRWHRWLGVSALVFILFLAVSGLLLNHATDLNLDRRYVSWSWLLDAYGIDAPQDVTSYADADIRASTIGGHLFLGAADTGQQVDDLAGVASLEPLVLVGGDRSAIVLMNTGELVEVVDLAAQLPGPIERVGRSGSSAVLQSGNVTLVSDSELAGFAIGDVADVSWSEASQPDTEDLAVLTAAYRGRGVTVERVLLDLHSGRLFSLPGTLFMDLVAICMILLGLSGLYLSISRNRRENGGKRRDGQ